MSKVETKMSVSEIIEQMSKEEEIAQLLQKIGIENIKSIESIKNEKVQEHHQNIIVIARKNGDTELQRIMIDIKKGQPTTNQVFDALYGKGVECVTKIIIFTRTLVEDDKNDPGANELVVQNFVKNIRRYGVDIHLVNVNQNQDKSLCFEIVETDDHDYEIEAAVLPAQEILREHEFWEVYYWIAYLQNFLYPWECFEGSLHNHYRGGHMYGLNGLDLYARLDEEGLSFQVKNSHHEYNYLETIWKCKKYDLQALFPDCEVKYVVPRGKLAQIEIKVWKTPMSSICTAPIPEKRRWAEKIFDKFGNLNYFLDSALWDLKEGKLEAPEEFIQLKEIA